MRTETVDKISVKYGVQSAVNSLEIPYKTENFREKGVNDKQDKSIIHLPRHDMNTPSKNPVKSRKIGIRTPSSTPFCTPNFLKIPDVTVLF